MTPSPVALVAGASRGLGLLTARQLLRRGYRVAICARTPADLTRAEETLSRDGEVHAFPCDVRDPEQIDRLLAQVRDSLGPIDVLVTVAGVIQVGPAASMTDEHYRDAIDIMLWAPIRLARAVLPDMLRRGHGRIGTVTSIGGRISPPHLLPYAAAKSGAVGFSEGLSAELAGTGVTSTTVVPGLMRIGSHERAHFTGDHGAEFAWFGPAASLPLLTISGERAARKIVDGVLAGRPVVTLSLLAKVATRVHGVAPATTVRLLGIQNRLLPKAPTVGEPSTTMTGRQARRTLSRPARATVDVLTTLGRRAARRTNERGDTAAQAN